MRRVIESRAAPRAVGPYSQAISAAGWVWVSGQIPLDPVSGQLVAGGIAEQVRCALGHVAAVLEAAGSSLERVVRVTVYLTDLTEFEAMNAVYAEFFGQAPPARACVQVAALPRGARVEVDAVALA